MAADQTRHATQRGIELPAELRADEPAEPTVLLHSCGHGPVLAFERPVDVLRVEHEDRFGAFERLRAFLAEHRDRPCAGYLGYELRDDIEPVEPEIVAARAPDPGPRLPVLWIAAFERREERREKRRDERRGASADGPRSGSSAADPAPVPAVARVTRREHERRVAEIVEAIRAGDIFQANLTQAFDARWDRDPRALFDRLCARSPAPFAAYLDSGAVDGAGERFQVLSSSPEEFLWRDGSTVRTRPIKGTRPRGRDAGSDAALAEELRCSSKDLAELAMIVDLMRNDLGKVAEVGSVQVGPFPETMVLPQVHHLYATVTARLRADVEAVDLLRATFPCGSITGAPKQRCMEILDRVEQGARRGVYTGAIGWFGPGPALHLNVAIRTLVRSADGRVRFDTGGGITARSDPAAEYDECLHKAAGMLAALGTEITAPEAG